MLHPCCRIGILFCWRTPKNVPPAKWRSAEVFRKLVHAVNAAKAFPCRRLFFRIGRCRCPARPSLLCRIFPIFLQECHLLRRIPADDLPLYQKGFSARFKFLSFTSFCPFALLPGIHLSKEMFIFRRLPTANLLGCARINLSPRHLPLNHLKHPPPRISSPGKLHNRIFSPSKPAHPPPVPSQLFRISGIRIIFR